MRIRHLISGPSTRALVGMAVMALVGVDPEPAAAQRPFRIHDPFYRSETARRTFYDGYAFTTELSYRTSGSIQNGQQTFSQDPFGLSFRLDYQIGQSFDLGAILDASGSNTGRSLGLSWITFKYYETEENSDYAFRVAVDPSVNGRLGAPQVDLAFLTTTLLSPSFSSDYAIGVRRVRIGYEQLIPGEPDQSENEAGEGVVVPRPASEIRYTRALGWELHGMVQYAYLFGAARNNLFLSALAYGGEYNILETSMRSAASVPAEGQDQPAAGANGRRQVGATIWIRTGMEYNRPSYQVTPFLNFAIARWASGEVERASRLNVGLRFMIR
jgi:hypothetical protein